MAKKNKETILWIGDHAKHIFMNTDKSVLSFYENKLLLFEREDNQNDPDIDVTYLDEFYPMFNRTYSVKDLNKPVCDYLKQINNNSNDGLIIGDGSEILFQAIVDSSYNQDLTLKEKQVDFSFQNVEKIDVTNDFQLMNLMNKDVLFLKEAMPFSDIIQEANKVKSIARKGFKNKLEANKTLNNLNEFLWDYHDGLEIALQKTEDISN